MKLIIEKSGNRRLDGNIPEEFRIRNRENVDSIYQKCSRFRTKFIVDKAFENYYENLEYILDFQKFEKEILDNLGITKVVCMPATNGISLSLINTDLEEHLLKSGYYVSNYQRSGDILIQHYSNKIADDYNFKKNILIQPIDGTVISPNHIEFMNSYDIIITPSTSGKQIMIENGINKPIIVIPNYYSENEPSNWFNENNLQSTKFTFYTESTGIKRKNIDNILLYFLKTFTSQDEVRLIIKTKLDKTNHLYKILEQFDDKPEVIILTDFLSQSDLLSIMSNIDAYICLSYMEGFCIPIINALKFKKKVIALDTKISGYKDFLTPSNSFLVKCHKIKIDFSEESLLIYEKSSIWESPDYQDFQAKLREVMVSKWKMIMKGKRIVFDNQLYSKSSVMKTYQKLFDSL